MNQTRTRGPEPAMAGREPWAVLAIVGIAQMLVMLDATVVNVALPSIGRDLPAGPVALHWTVSGYLLTYGSLLLVGGRLSDAWGRRATFVTGLAVFAVASLACGVAGTETVLVTARVVQGVGAALLSASALSIIVAKYRDAQLHTALTVWSGLGVVGATIGVILGGVVVDWLSWRWVFLLNIPLCLVVGLAARLRLAPMRPTRSRTPRLPTAIAVTAGLGSLSYGFIRLQEGSGQWQSWAAFGLSVLLLTLAVRRERGHSDPLIPLFLLKDAAYAWACFGLVLAGTLMLGALYLSSNYLQATHGMSALETGIALVPLCLGSLIAAFAVPSVAARVGMATVFRLGVGVQLLSIAVIVLATSSSTGDWRVVVGVLALFGLGLPAMFVPLYTFGAGHIAEEHAGVGSGLLNTFNESGAGVGLAIVAPLSAAVIARSQSRDRGEELATAAGTHAGFLVLAVLAILAGVTATALAAVARRRAALAEQTAP